MGAKLNLEQHPPLKREIAGSMPAAPTVVGWSWTFVAGRHEPRYRITTTSGSGAASAVGRKIVAL